MKIISWNVTGMNGSSKQRMLKWKIKKENPVVIFTHETKCTIEATLKLMTKIWKKIWKGAKVSPMMLEEPQVIFPSYGTIFSSPIET